MDNCNQCGMMICGCAYSDLNAAQYANTLIPSLTNVADNIRNIATTLGARPYEVALIWTQWAGGERGHGAQQIVKRVPLLPTPYVKDIATMNTQLTNIGIAEMGTVRVSEISPSYNEDFLNGILEGTRIPKDVSFFWEIYYPQPNGVGVRRRMTPKTPPTYHADKFQWQIVLTRESEDRARNGDLR